MLENFLVPSRVKTLRLTNHSTRHFYNRVARYFVQCDECVVLNFLAALFHVCPPQVLLHLTNPFLICFTRYLKYLTKKYLKKNNLRDWLRVVANSKEVGVIVPSRLRVLKYVETRVIFLS